MGLSASDRSICSNLVIALSTGFKLQLVGNTNHGQTEHSPKRLGTLGHPGRTPSMGTLALFRHVQRHARSLRNLSYMFIAEPESGRAFPSLVALGYFFTSFTAADLGRG